MTAVRLLAAIPRGSGGVGAEVTGLTGEGEPTPGEGPGVILGDPLRFVMGTVARPARAVMLRELFPQTLPD